MKFRVHFEASAAIGIEIEVEAKDKIQAEEYAMRMVDAGDLPFAALVEELLKPHPEATRGYAEATMMPIKYVTVEEDESGFEVVDIFEPENGQ